MKKIIALLALVATQAFSATVIQVKEDPGVNDLYKGTKKLGSYPTGSACTDAAKALATPKETKFFCKNTRTLLVTQVTVADPPPTHMHGGIQGIKHDNMLLASSDGYSFQPGVDTMQLSPPVPFGPPPALTDWEQPGAVRQVCKPSHMSNDDAIVYPGQSGLAHDHTFFRPGTDAFLTNANVRAPGNKSTCRGGTLDLTGRWVPTMYNTVDMQAVIPHALLIYYKTTNCNYSIPCSGTSDYTSAAATAMNWVPQGYHIIAGDPTATAPSGRSFFSCFGEGGTSRDGTGNQTTIPACLPGEQLWMIIHFPQCVATDSAGNPILDSPDHKSHAAYMEGWPAYNSPFPAKAYRCPSTHPFQIPDITFNVQFDVLPGMDTTKWNLSCGTQYCGHGDWFDGWEPVIMKATNEECLRKRRDCGTFVIYNGSTAQEFQGN